MLYQLITSEPTLLGDVDNDGSIDYTDARLVLMGSIGIMTLPYHTEYYINSCLGREVINSKILNLIKLLK